MCSVRPRQSAKFVDVDQVLRADDMLCVRMMGNLGCIRATVRSDFSGNPAVGVPCATSDVDTT